MKTAIQMLVIGVAGLIITVSARATMVFQDRIMNYTAGTAYVADNPAVIQAQDNGNIYGPPVSGVYTSLGAWSTSGGNEFVDMSSGNQHAYTTIAVPANSTDYYGQIYARVGTSASSGWMRLIMSTNSIPTLNQQDIVTPGTGADLIFDPGNSFRYYNGNTLVSSSAEPTTTQMYDVTINYDLQLHTYDVWVGANELVGGAAFSDAGFGSTVRSIALGGQWWSNQDGNHNAVLDQWYWNTDNSTAFTSFGVFVPEPSSLMLLGVGVALVYARRRRTE